MSGGIDFEGGGAAPAACVACGKPLAGEYWEANGKVACTSCKERIDVSSLEGTPMSRFLMASALGTGAALVGTLVWWGVAHFTGFEAAIIAIGIGWLVGTAVQRGSNARGGKGYQFLAVGLTYLSIVFAYMFLGYESLDQAQRDELGIAAWPILFVISLAGPFLGGLSSILSVIIVGVGLLQAWSKNRKFEIFWSGPHRIAAPGSDAAAADAPPSRLPPLPGTASRTEPPPLPPAPPDAG